MEPEKTIWEGGGPIIYGFKINTINKDLSNPNQKPENLIENWKYEMSVGGASGEYEMDVPDTLFLADTPNGLIRDIATYIDIAAKKQNNSFQNLPSINPNNIRITEDSDVFNNINIDYIFKNASTLANQSPPKGEAAYVIEINEDENQPLDNKYNVKIVYANGVLNAPELESSDEYLKEGINKFQGISAQMVPKVIANYILTTATKNEIPPTQINTKILNFTNNPNFTLNKITSYMLATIPRQRPYQTQANMNNPNKSPIPETHNSHTETENENEKSLKSDNEKIEDEIEKSDEEKPTKKGLKFYEPDYGFDSVIGMDKEKEFLYNNIILGLERPDLFKKYKKSINDGFIFYGPPGTGKTYLAGALAHEADMKLLIVNIHQLLDQYVGNTEKNIHEIFEEARKNQPCIILFDEIDGLGMSRNRSKEGGSGSSALALNQILMEMDSLGSKNDGIIVIGTTNEPQDIDTALLRSGRFTNLLYISPPDKETREKLFEFYSDDIPKDYIDYSLLGKESTNFSPADIKATVKAAVTPLIAQAAKDGEEKDLDTEDLLTAIRKRRASGSTLVKWYEDMDKLAKKGDFTENEKLEYAPMFNDMKNHIKTPKKKQKSKKKQRKRVRA